MSLQLCHYLYGSERSSAQPICVWSDKTSLRTMKQFAMQPHSAPQRSKKMTMRPLRLRGRMPLHPFIDNERHLHLAKFCSLVPLHTITSPGRIAALFVAARLFPLRWRALYAAAFHGEQLDVRTSATVDRFNDVMSEPDCYELIELADIHTAYQRPMTREVRFATESPLLSFFAAMKPLACAVFAVEKQKSATTYQLTSFLAIAHAALNRGAQKTLVQFLDRHAVCTKRQLRAFETAWIGAAAALSDGFVAGVIGQFTFVK